MIESTATPSAWDCPEQETITETRGIPSSFPEFAPSTEHSVGAEGPTRNARDDPSRGRPWRAFSRLRVPKALSSMWRGAESAPRLRVLRVGGRADLPWPYLRMRGRPCGLAGQVIQAERLALEENSRRVGVGSTQTGPGGRKRPGPSRIRGSRRVGGKTRKAPGRSPGPSLNNHQR